jgi:ornithine decarboxylase
MLRTLAPRSLIDHIVRPSRYFIYLGVCALKASLRLSTNKNEKRQAATMALQAQRSTKQSAISLDHCNSSRTTQIMKPMDDQEGRFPGNQSKAKCLDAEIPDNELPFDENALPLPYEHIPASIATLKECAEHQIRSLLDKDPSLWTPEDEDAVDDGFVLCDINVVRKKLSVWRSLFPRIKPFMALKCNPDPMVAAVLGLSGAAGFDCASVPEIRLALQSCRRSSQSATESDASRFCVYANPQRAEKDLDTALALSVRSLTFDGSEELRKVHRAYQKQVEASADDNVPPPPPPDMILRVLVPDHHSTVPLGEKFGASPITVKLLTELAVQLQLPIVGVSFHCGSGNHDPTSFKTAIQLAVEAMEVVDRVQQAAGIRETCWLLDIGGGYPGLDGMGGDRFRFVGSDAQRLQQPGDKNDSKEEESAANIAHIVSPLLDELFPADTSHVQFISEPGRYFVEGAFALCSRIYRVRVEQDANGKEDRMHYYIAQGVQGVFKDCVLCSESFLPIPLALDHSSSDEDAASSVSSMKCTVHGPSGEDYDIICQDYDLPVLKIGDWLIFDRMGAYTLSIAARNGRPPVRYLMGDSSLQVAPS